MMVRKVVTMISNFILNISKILTIRVSKLIKKMFFRLVVTYEGENMYILSGVYVYLCVINVVLSSILFFSGTVLHFLHFLFSLFSGDYNKIKNYHMRRFFYYTVSIFILAVLKFAFPFLAYLFILLPVYPVLSYFREYGFNVFSYLFFFVYFKQTERFLRSALDFFKNSQFFITDDKSC